MIKGLIVLFAIIGAGIICYACCKVAGDADDEAPVIRSENDE